MRSDQRSAVISAMKNIIPFFIKNSSDVYHVLENLTQGNRASVYEIIKVHMRKIINTANDFENVLRYLPSEQREEVYVSMKDYLPPMIHDAECFESVLKYLDSSQRKEVYLVVKDRKPDIVKVAEDILIHAGKFPKRERKVIYANLASDLLCSVQVGDIVKYLSKILDADDLKNIAKSRGKKSGISKVAQFFCNSDSSSVQSLCQHVKRPDPGDPHFFPPEKKRKTSAVSGCSAMQPTF